MRADRAVADKIKPVKSNRGGCSRGRTFSMSHQIRATSMIPTGMLMKKTHRQFRHSVSSPPRVGPRAGAKEAEMP